MINASREPFSNVAVSTGKDVDRSLLALAIANPIAAAIIALALVFLSLWLVFAARRAPRRLLPRAAIANGWPLKSRTSTCPRLTLM
jgi:hypothetical protein